MRDLLLTSRRNFLTRAFGVTVGGAAVTVPIVTVVSAEERLRHHMAGVEAAMGDLFPMCTIWARGNCLDGHHPYWSERFAKGDHGAYACAIVAAGLPLDGETLARGRPHHG
jgi:hypothetical protein